MKRFTCYLIVLLFASTGLLAQDYSAQEFGHTVLNKTIVPPSPEAASLGTYGNSPVSLSNGRPQTGISLSPLSGSGLKLNISLSYDHSGFRPSDAATWVGLSWSLNAGGVITRSVLGDPDKDDNYFNVSVSRPLTPDIFEIESYYDLVKGGDVEDKPDTYFFNFSDYAGKFGVKRNGDVLIKEKGDLVLKAQRDVNGELYFEAIDGQGIEYIFRDKEYTTMIPMDIANVTYSRIHNFISSWYLSEIRNTQTNEKILFEYHTAAAEQVLSGDQNSIYTYSVPSYQRAGCSVSPSSHSSVVIEPFTSITRKYLKKVTLYRSEIAVSYVDLISQNSRMDNSSAESRKLVRLDYYNLVNGQMIYTDSFKLYHGYFANMNHLLPEDRYRLRLDSVKQVSAQDSLEAYVFDYYGGDLPRRNTKGIDHWGFYNGATSNISLIPNVNIGSEVSPLWIGQGAVRDPQLYATMTTVLKSIRYPTKGSTRFTYTLNSARYDNRNLSVGGLRVSSKEDLLAADRVAIRTEYDYEEAGSSMGLIGVLPEYLTVTSLQQTVSSLDFCESSKSGEKNYNIYSSSIYGLGRFNGSHVYYTKVKEKQVDPATSKVIAETHYYFKEGIYLQYDEDLMSGKLWKTQWFNNEARLLKEEVTTYQSVSIADDIQAYFIEPLSIQDDKYYYCKLSNGSYANVNAQYNLPSNCVQTKTIRFRKLIWNYKVLTPQLIRVVHREETEFDKTGQAFSKKTAYSYNNENIRPNKTEYTDSEGRTLVQENSYLTDVVGSGPLASFPFWIRSLYNKNLRYTELEKITYRLDNNIRYYINGEVSIYEHHSSVPSKVYRLSNLKSGLNTFTLGTVSNDQFVFDPNYKLEMQTKLDANSNLRELTQRNGRTVSYIWDPVLLSPVAKVENTVSNYIAYAGFETADIGGWGSYLPIVASSDALLGNRSFNLVTGNYLSKIFTTPVPGKMIVNLWVKNSNGLLISINNDVTVPHTIVEQRNGWSNIEALLPENTIGVKIQAVNALIDEVRIHPQLASMQTYEQRGNKLTGSANENNTPSYYDYDIFRRLSSIRDQDRFILKSYNYRFGQPALSSQASPTVFYNMAAVQSFTKNNCTDPASVPTSMYYSVPYAKYVSTISQQDADQMAQAEISANGQDFANQNGKCLFYNDEKSQRFFKAGCPGGILLRVMYRVPAGKYSSEISKADANQLALQDIEDNGQNHADATSCGCDTPDKKIINGNCETGIRIEYSSNYLGYDRWECKYRYVFSNGTYSAILSEINSTPCPQNN